MRKEKFTLNDLGKYLKKINLKEVSNGLSSSIAFFVIIPMFSTILAFVIVAIFHALNIDNI